MSMTEDGRKAEHMTKGELVQEFRRLQSWYNKLKEATTNLEKEHAELHLAHQESINLNLTMTQRVSNLQTLLQNQITDSNENKQMLLKRIQQYQMKIQEFR